MESSMAQGRHIIAQKGREGTQEAQEAQDHVPSLPIIMVQGARISK
jgi:hypothetical protein